LGRQRDAWRGQIRNLVKHRDDSRADDREFMRYFGAIEMLTLVIGDIDRLITESSVSDQ
jgi:hypothetical protein